jgi:hypothetical protein
MQGKSTIQMINPFTQKVEEQFENKNLITNAISNAFKTSVLYKNKFHTETTINNYIKQLTPLSTKGLGGILLWDNTLTEDIDLVDAPMTVNNIGRAGGSYSGSNEYRGTLNSLESGVITNGWRNVWDFDTAKCNGQTIKALTLTHRNTGNNGWMSLSEQNEKESQCFHQQASPCFDLGDSNSYFVTMLSDTKALYAKKGSDTTWILNELEIPNTAEGYKLTDLEIGATKKGADITVTFEGTQNKRIPYVGSRVGNIVHFICVLGTTSFSHVQLDLTNYTVTETLKNTGVTLSTESYYAKNCIYFDGFYYLCDNSYNITKQNLDGTLNTNLNISLNNQFYDVGIYNNKIIWGCYTYSTKPINTFIICDGTNIKFMSEAMSGGPTDKYYLGTIITPYSTKIKHPMLWSKRHGSGDSGLTLMGTNYYLGSINNLATPIVKTADFNMKIIYEITND